MNIVLNIILSFVISGLFVISPYVGLLTLTLFAFIYLLKGSESFLSLWFVFLCSGGVFVSYWSPLIETRLTFDLLRGVDFLYLFLGFIIIYLRKILLLGFYSSDIKLTLVLVFLFAYFLLGVVNVGFSGAATYLRYYLYPVILVYILVTEKNSVSINSLVALFAVLTLLVFLENLLSLEYFELIGLYDYLNLKFDRYIPSLEYFLQTRNIVILSYDTIYIEGFRGLGPTMHPISGAYLIAGLGVLLTFHYKSWIFIVISTLCSLMLLSKGAIIFILFMGIAIYFQNLKSKIPIYLSFSFAILLVLFGLLTNNPHHWSLLSSIYNLPANIFGRGIGFGGTISTGTSYSTDLSESSGDSALAISLNMFGLFGAIGYAWILYKAYKLASSKIIDNEGRMIGFFIFTLACNGISQEEALNPYAIAPVFLWAFMYKNKLKSNERIN